jgi:hypothetical protein
MQTTKIQTTSSSKALKRSRAAMQEEDKLDDAEARIIIPRDPVVEKKRIVTGRFNPGVADRLQEAFEQQLTLPNV